jgi:membrane associated rhomboid family serine protease
MSNFGYTRPHTLPPIVKNLIIINVLVFVAQLTLKQFEITERFSLYPLMPAELLEIAKSSPGMQPYYGFQPYQIATHMFSHSPGSFFHILFNMFALWMFGKILENVWGPKRFLFFYLACGVGAAACHLAIQYFRCEALLDALNANSPNISSLTGALSPALGASGAVMGIMAAFAFLFPNTEMFIMFIPMPVKAKWAVLGYIAIDLLGGLGVYNDNVAHFAHLGGALTGFIIVLIWNKTGRRRFY